MSKQSGQCGQVILRHGRYVGRYYVDTPKRRIRKAVVLGLKSEMTKPEAKRRLMEAISIEGINAPTYLERALGSAKTFNEVADKWELMRLPRLGQSSQYMNPKLVAKHLRPFFGAMAIDEIKTGMINEWISTAMKDFEPKTVHNMYKLFRAIVNWYYRQEDQQPRKWSPDLPPLKEEEQRWFTSVEAALIVANAEGRNKMLFHLAASTGMRAGELFGLKVEDVDFKRRLIRVVRSTWKDREVPTKTRKGYREIFIDENTVQALQQYLNSRKTGLIFPSMQDRDVVVDVLYPLCDRLGIKRGGMHAFRHGRVSLMRVSGAPEDLVKRQIGHSSLKTPPAIHTFQRTFNGTSQTSSLGLSSQSWTHSKRL